MKLYIKYGLYLLIGLFFAEVKTTNIETKLLEKSRQKLIICYKKVLRANAALIKRLDRKCKRPTSYTELENLKRNIESAKKYRAWIMALKEIAENHSGVDLHNASKNLNLLRCCPYDRDNKITNQDCHLYRAGKDFIEVDEGNNLGYLADRV